MTSLQTPLDLFFDQLRDIHSMESQLCDSLPELAALSSDGGLRDAIAAHSHETDRQLEFILEIFERHRVPVGKDKCKAIAGLIAGGDSHLESAKNPHTRDLMMVAHCLRIEHYEIAAYEITSRLADRLGLELEANLLNELMAQEMEMARWLTEFEPYLFQSAVESVVSEPGIR